jgi:hypothetical protein
MMAGIGLSSPNGTGEGVADRPTAVSGGQNFSRQGSSTLNDKLAAALPPCVEGHGVDNDTINGGRLAAQHILGTGFEFRALLPKARVPLGERSADQTGSVLKGLPRDVDDDLPAAPISDQSKPVPVDEIIQAKGDRIRPQSDSTAGQKFNLSGRQGHRHGPTVVRGWEASTGFKIFDRAQPKLCCRGELSLRPVEQPARSAACRSADKHAQGYLTLDLSNPL